MEGLLSLLIRRLLSLCNKIWPKAFHLKTLQNGANENEAKGFVSIGPGLGLTLIVNLKII